MSEAANGAVFMQVYHLSGSDPRPGPLRCLWSLANSSNEMPGPDTRRQNLMAVRLSTYRLDYRGDTLVRSRTRRNVFFARRVFQGLACAGADVLIDCLHLPLRHPIELWHKPW